MKESMEKTSFVPLTEADRLIGVQAAEQYRQAYQERVASLTATGLTTEQAVAILAAAGREGI